MEQSPAATIGKPSSKEKAGSKERPPQFGSKERPPQSGSKERPPQLSSPQDQAAQPQGTGILSPERQRNFVPRQGYAYFLVSIPFTPGVRFGLGVKHYRNQVLVSKVEDGSMVSDSLKIMDRVIDVNSKPVTDKDVCKTLIVKSLQQNGEVNMIIERPVEPEAIAANENALNASKMQEPSIAMASDVKSILRRYNEKLKQGHGQMQPRRALADPNNPRPDGPRVAIERPEGKSHITMLIGSDFTASQHEQMAKVPPRPSMFAPRQ